MWKMMKVLESSTFYKNTAAAAAIKPNPTAHLLAAKTLEIRAQQSESFRRILRAQLAALARWMGQDMSRYVKILSYQPTQPT